MNRPIISAAQPNKQLIGGLYSNFKKIDKKMPEFKSDNPGILTVFRFAINY